MPRATWIQQNFNAGEWSPLAYGRVGLEKYKNALATCLNYVPTPQGGLTRRPGNYYVAQTKTANRSARLQRFEYSTTQAYVLEFGEQYIRFYANDGQLQTSGVAAYNGATAYKVGDLCTNGGITYYCIAATTGNAPPNATYWYAQSGTIFEVPTPYLEADLFNLNFAQSADVLYITHPSYAPRKLQRTGATAWTLSTISFTDGPYLPVNTTTTTITLSGVGPGVVTATASATTGINNDAGFKASDVGRMFRFKSGANWGWGTITAFTDTTHVSVTLTTAPSAAAASTTWRLGAWGSALGYPGCVVFHQDRLVFAGTTNYPQRVDGSNSSDYENFAPSAADGTISDANSYSFNLNSNTVNLIRWLISDDRGLLAGTAGGEWVLSQSSTAPAITPTNVSAKQPTTYGSAAVAAIKVGRGTLFVQRNARRVREMAYVFTVDGYQTPDITQLAEHLTKRGLKQMAVQLTPYQVVWAAANDGSLLSLTYDREQDIVGWAQHTVGGYYDAAKTQAAKVESVACIPSPDGTRDELYMVVNRYINGARVRYIERSAKYWEDGDSLTTCCFLDSAGTYSGAATKTISGLTWLKGETVSVLTDGAAHPNCVVDSSGNITLQWNCTSAVVGLPYNSDGKTMRIEAGGADGTAQGKLKRIHRVIVRLFQSVGLNISDVANGANLIDEPFRSSADSMTSAVSLFTGDKRWTFEGTWGTEGQVFWRQSQPLPSNILAIVAQLETQDGG